MTNPILDEIHAVRQQILADAGGTLDNLVAKIQRDQAQSGRLVVRKGDELPISRNDAPIDLATDDFSSQSTAK